MNFRFGTREDVVTLGKALKDSWLMHVDNEPKFVNRKIIEDSDLVNYFADCFNHSEKSYFLIAEIGKDIAGFAKINIEDIQKFFNQTKILYVDDIYTFEQYRGKGISSFLIKQVENIAKEKGIKWLKARIYDFNKPAQAAFESVGFKNLYSEYFKILE